MSGTEYVTVEIPAEVANGALQAETRDKLDQFTIADLVRQTSFGTG
jgi:hypothetical protein